MQRDKGAARLTQNFVIWKTWNGFPLFYASGEGAPG
jgi:hypothetical protein